MPNRTVSYPKTHQYLQPRPLGNPNFPCLLNIRRQRRLSWASVVSLPSTNVEATGTVDTFSTAPVDTFSRGKDSISLIVTVLAGLLRATKPITGKKNGRTLGDLGRTNQPPQPLPTGQLSYCRKSYQREPHSCPTRVHDFYKGPGYPSARNTNAFITISFNHTVLNYLFMTNEMHNLNV